ncbi:MerR family transcriptional regulator [Microbacterium sp. SA39]|uniref:MerR family transcriptional regulator n=1 Tax=Microbacterium sp. SA39 TaxID=1263625 RepID=UPI0005F9FBAE|nr:MerR family transcriptional regulator [Microbacterium sp. SA39]KJQ52709.1 Mercuric resistance operon regulatory protein [Microbacterium sp. SA39]
MTWSTREIADLAGTTVNTVRHYHREGLLELPERTSNGYKQYTVRHLVRLLQIRRLRDLGVPLDRIDVVGDEGGAAMDALHAVDADLGLSIERLQRARAEIRAIREGASLTDVPSGFERLAKKMSTSERSLMLIYAQLYDEEAMADIREMLAQEPEGASVEFDSLSADADEATRSRLAESYGRTLARHLHDYPWLSDPKAHLTKSPNATRDTFVESVSALYNPAQLDVMGRASVIAHALIEGTDDA